jgi:hypothetical protein
LNMRDPKTLRWRSASSAPIRKKSLAKLPSSSRFANQCSMKAFRQVLSSGTCPFVKSIRCSSNRAGRVSDVASISVSPNTSIATSEMGDGKPRAQSLASSANCRCKLSSALPSKRRADRRFRTKPRPQEIGSNIESLPRSCSGHTICLVRARAYLD